MSESSTPDKPTEIVHAAVLKQLIAHRGNAALHVRITPLRPESFLDRNRAPAPHVILRTANSPSSGRPDRAKGVASNRSRPLQLRFAERKRQRRIRNIRRRSSRRCRFNKFATRNRIGSRYGPSSFSRSDAQNRTAAHILPKRGAAVLRPTRDRSNQWNRAYFISIRLCGITVSLWAE